MISIDREESVEIGGEEKVPPALAPEIGQPMVEVLRAAGFTGNEYCVIRLRQRTCA